MCGILAIHGLERSPNDRARFIALSKRLRHRGPDWSGCFVGNDCTLVHERLAIVGIGKFLFSFHECSLELKLVDTGAQPLVSEDGKLVLAVNGEIYNHAVLRTMVSPDVKFKTHSDCEVILPLVSIQPRRVPCL
jgi:asparagine synthase (glutamine-hydrolysing)